MLSPQEFTIITSEDFNLGASLIASAKACEANHLFLCKKSIYYFYILALRQHKDLEKFQIDLFLKVYLKVLKNIYLALYFLLCPFILTTNCSKSLASLKSV